MPAYINVRVYNVSVIGKAVDFSALFPAAATAVVGLNRISHFAPSIAVALVFAEADK